MGIKIAAVSDDGQTISMHFGRAKFYVVLTIENGKIIAREQREKMAHHHSTNEPHELHEGGEHRHGFSPAEQDRHFQMADAIKDCQFLLARGMGSGAYFSLEQVGIRPIITTIASIDEAALQAAQGTIVDHKEKLH
jgi:predicted Fe-Mo cluster-binding NifX family protein